MVFKAENKNDYDVFYSVPFSKQSNGTKAVSILENKFFSQPTARNSASLFVDNINFLGEKANLLLMMRSFYFQF